MSYNHKEVMRLYRLNPSLEEHRFDRMAQAQKWARWAQITRGEKAPCEARGEHSTLTGWSKQPRKLAGHDCWCVGHHPKAALTYDDWGEGPQCTICGRFKGET